MSDEQKEVTGRTLGDALYNLVEWVGCLGLLLLMGTCAGCWTIPGVRR